jgi:hypothetical protein
MLNFAIQLVDIDRIIVLGGSAVFYTALALVMGLLYTGRKAKVAVA